MKRRFKIGDMVKVVLPEEVPRESPGWEYDDLELVVTKVVYGKKATSVQLELGGALPYMGTPYTFLGEWVKLMPEGGRK